MSATADDLARRAAALLERANADPPTTWKPRDRAARHPQAIAGEVVEKATKIGRGWNGADVDVVTIRTPEGAEWSVWCFGAILEQDLAGVQVGDVVAVKYEGHREGKNNGYELFRVVVHRGGFGRLPAGVETPAAADDSAGITAPIRCEACGFDEPEHAQGCPNEIPF
jgi:hypothetical protein